jgi:hypothetical protein
MITIPRKFYDDAEPTYEPTAFFTNMLLKLKGKAALSRLSPENFADIINDQDRDNKNVEPEEVLDYEGTLYPDNLKAGFTFKNKRLHGFRVTLFLHRKGNDMHWSLWLGLDDDDFFSYPFNLSRIENDLILQGDKFGFRCEPCEQETGGFSTCVEVILPIKGNMLQQFNKLWNDVESIYNNSAKNLVAVVKAGY